MKLAGTHYRKVRLNPTEMMENTQDSDAVGFHNTRTQEIATIKATPECERRILWHEAVHIFDDTADIGLNESQVNMLAMLIDCAVQDNEDLR